MQLLSWLYKRMTDRPQNRRTPARKPSWRGRLQLEVLEGRVVPSTLTVTTAADTGVGSLRTEINLAQSGDTIVFAPSMAGKTITEIYGELSIGKNLTIQGPGASKLAVSGAGHRAFEVSAGARVAVSGLTVEFGGSNAGQDHGGEGGGFLNLGTLTLSGCTVSNNRGTEGGGIYNAGTLTLSGCTVSKNSANEGGGIYNAASATLSISQSTLSADSAASHGGGIYNAGALTVLDSIFSGNTPDNIYGYYTDGGGNTFD